MPLSKIKGIINNGKKLIFVANPNPHITENPIRNIIFFLESKFFERINQTDIEINKSITKTIKLSAEKTLICP